MPNSSAPNSFPGKSGESMHKREEAIILTIGTPATDWIVVLQDGTILDGDGNNISHQPLRIRELLLDYAGVTEKEEVKGFNFPVEVRAAEDEASMDVELSVEVGPLLRAAFGEGARYDDFQVVDSFPSMGKIYTLVQATRT